MRAITFTIELLEPLLATGLESDPNSNVSLGYVPGSVLRGALIAKHLRKLSKPDDFDPANEIERKLFFDGTVRYLNAYPLARISDDEEIRNLPTPQCWHAKKDAEPSDSGTKVYDLCFSDPAKVRYECDEQSKQISGEFFFFHPSFDNSVVTFHPARRLAVHTQRERRHGRAIKDDGAVYRYEALAPGERFGGAILFADDAEKALINEIESLLSGKQLNLGGSRTAGYGRAEIRNLISTGTNSNWSEIPFSDSSFLSAGITPDETFTITFLSNALVRNESGQYQAGLSLEELKKHLGEIEEAKCDDGKGGEYNCTFKRAEIVGGFNRKWGLPLPQAVSLKAGSVFTFKAKDMIDAHKLKVLIDAGVGERRAEGFGRITVNLNKNKSGELTWRKFEKKKDYEAQAIKDSLSRTLSERMLKRILRQRLDRKLLEQVGRFELNNAPPNHQISRLRLVVRQALRENKEHLVTDFFTKGKRIAERHFEKAKVKDKNDNKQKQLLTWITETLKNQNLIEPPSLSSLSLGKDEGETKRLKAEYTHDLKCEFHLRLIDGVLAHAAKENNRNVR